MKNKFYTYIQNLQDQICKGLEDIDGGTNFVKIFGNDQKVAEVALA